MEFYSLAVRACTAPAYVDDFAVPARAVRERRQ